MADYHKYILDKKKRVMIRNFEGAYANCQMVYPTQSEVDTVKHRLITQTLKNMSPEIEILDVGCGYGCFSDYLSSNLEIDVYGCDVSPTALRKGLQIHNQAQFVTGDLSQGLPFKSVTFDAVLCLGVLSMLFDKIEKCLIEMRRVLKKEGLLIVSAGIPENPIGAEWVKDKNEFYDKIARFFQITEACLVWDHKGLKSGNSLDVCDDDLVILAQKI